MQSSNQDWFQRFLSYVRIERGLSTNTLVSYRHDLALYAEHLGAASVLEAGPAEISAFLKFLYGRGLKPRSAARALAAVRSFYRFLLLEKVIERNPTAVVDPPHIFVPLPHFLSLTRFQAP